jgi:hypothetical protein
MLRDHLKLLKKFKDYIGNGIFFKPFNFFVKKIIINKKNNYHDNNAGKVNAFISSETSYSYKDHRFFKIFAENVVRECGSQTYVIVSLYSLGDTYLLCSLAKSFRSIHCMNGGKIVVVIKESHLAIAELFIDEIDSIYLMSQHVAERVLRHLLDNRLKCSFGPGEALFIHPHHVNDTRVDDYTNLEGVSQVNMYANLLRLPIRTPPETPKISEENRLEAKNLADEYGVIKNKSVVLFPDSNSWPQLPVTFWEKLSISLDKKGWTVFTNSAGNNNSGSRTKPLPSSSLIDLPVRLVIPFLEEAGWVVGALCGLMNIVISSQTRCKKTIVVRGPAHSKTLQFNEFIKVESAFPYAYQRKFDGFNYDIEEIQVRDDDDYDILVKKISEGFNASFDTISTFSPVNRLWVELSPGELVDKITILEVKMEKLPSHKTIFVAKELDVLRETLLSFTNGITTELKERMDELRRLNRLGWEFNEHIYRQFDDPEFGIPSWQLVATDTKMVSDAANVVRNIRASQQANRDRIIAKNQINQLLSSAWFEKKSFDA